MTNEQLTQGFFGILQRLDVMATSMQTLHDGQQAIRQALLTGHPGLQPLPLPSPMTIAALLPCPPVPTPGAVATMDQPSAGVPIHMMLFPPSSSPIPSWAHGPLPVSLPIYSTPITTAVPQSSATPTVLGALGDDPALGTRYGGVDGTLVSSFAGSSSAGGNPSQGRATPVPPLAPDGDRLPPKFYKLEFPTYDGAEDPLNWLNHCIRTTNSMVVPVLIKGERFLAAPPAAPERRAGSSMAPQR
ncbi:hypothetical protein GUJ93_ZPchr0013g34668 [Zizania palustris]|uniref:Uncharacterized protein n=1 Tax=Zizania palustris TaxID=103762 RepID=A0A8J5WZR2_ZIZPA|nr:hypothetical protein GUJ93_ZPchr0013g34668 [Zizania palustris]